MIGAWVTSVTGPATPAAALTCGSHKNPAIAKTILSRTDPPCCNEERAAEFLQANNIGAAVAWRELQRCIAATAQAAMVSPLRKAGG